MLSRRVADSTFVQYLALLLAAAIGYVAARVRRWWVLKRPSGRLWKLKHRSELVVVTPDERDYDQSALSDRVLPSDYIAINQIRAFLKQTLGVETALYSANEFPSEAYRGNLLLIGNANSNSVVRTVVKQIGDKTALPAQITTDGRIVDTATDEVLATSKVMFDERSHRTELIGEAAMIVNLSNPLGSGTRVVMVAGCHSQGNQLAASLLVDRQLFGKVRLNELREGYCIVVEGDVIRRLVGMPSIKRVYRYDDRSRSWAKE